MSPRQKPKRAPWRPRPRARRGKAAKKRGVRGKPATRTPRQDNARLVRFLQKNQVVRATVMVKRRPNKFLGQKREILRTYEYRDGRFTRAPPEERVRPGALVITSFKAQGGMTGFHTSRYDAFTYANLSGQIPKGLVNGPGVFYSQEPYFLGQVNFPGRQPLDRLLELLNRSLNLRDKKGRAHDFRDIYERWEYTYQVFQKDARNKRQIVSLIRGSNRIGRKRVYK